ncbi:MAG: helix-turn-helix transcriptional regulator [Rhizobiaceae bacterium]|jgi:AraC-like DNA-binding protein
MRGRIEPEDREGFSYLHARRLDWLERSHGALVAIPAVYPDGLHVPMHRHSRAQLLQALHGVVMVMTNAGRWMVPPDHAMWIPAGIEHAVDILGDVEMHSIYAEPGALSGPMQKLRVVEVTDFVRSLIVEVSREAERDAGSQRFGLLSALLLHEIPNLREVPLALPLPTEPKLAALCQAFVRNPSSRAAIEDWADQLGMSRRTFTRNFHRQTNLSLSTWRQQACIFAALPRLAEGQPVTRVALDLGYDSVPAFTTMFRRMTGISPRRYLQKKKAA